VDATWAENEEFDEDTEFYKAGKTYYEVLWTAPKGNPYFILAHQFIAAKLNVLAGAPDEGISAELADAAALFTSTAPGDALASKAVFLELAGALGEYNEGYSGPGHCE
jgi:hypothetical protein